MILKGLLCAFGGALETFFFWLIAAWMLEQPVPLWAYLLTASIGWESVRSYLYTHPIED